jgi:nucleoside-diphosphate-sugar epimerase
MLSFVHADDVGQVARLAIERPAPGEAFNVAGDEAATLLDAVRAQAEALGAPAPRTSPAFAVKLLVGPYLWPPVLLSNVVTNAKAKQRLGFVPRHPRVGEMVRAVAQG